MGERGETSWGVIIIAILFLGVLLWIMSLSQTPMP